MVCLICLRVFCWVILLMLVFWWMFEYGLILICWFVFEFWLVDGLELSLFVCIFDGVLSLLLVCLLMVWFWFGFIIDVIRLTWLCFCVYCFVLLMLLLIGLICRFVVCCLLILTLRFEFVFSMFSFVYLLLGWFYDICFCWLDWILFTGLYFVGYIGFAFGCLAVFSLYFGLTSFVLCLLLIVFVGLVCFLVLFNRFGLHYADDWFYYNVDWV